MSTNNTVDQNNIKMTLRSRKKSTRTLVGVISKRKRTGRQVGVPALERVTDRTYTAGLENTVSVVPPTKIKVPTALHFREPIH